MKENPYKIKHKYKERIFVPYVAIENNMQFFEEYMRNKVCDVITSDGIECKATEVKERCIIDIANTILQSYAMSAWDYLRLWHKTYPQMDSITFLEIKLTK